MRFVAIAAALFVAATAHAGDVQFDPQKAIENRLVDAAADDAEDCIHGILVVDLSRGVRDRETLIASSVSQCEPGLTARLASIKPSFAQKPVRSLLVSSANRQLEGILAEGR